MSAERFAVTEFGYRVISEDMEINPGETVVSVLPGPLLNAAQAHEVLSQRNQLLRDTDWTQMADAPLTIAQKTAMSVYRQALRDLPSLPGFPHIAWPALPQLSGAAGDIKAPM